jgi:hypothetical protein
MAFGFGFSLPNIRKVGAAPFVPVTLVQENWVGSGLVAGRTPSPTNSGGGTWQVNSSSPASSYAAGEALTAVDDGSSTFRYSATLTDANMTTRAEPRVDGGLNSPLTVYARSTPGPTADATSFYRLTVYTSIIFLSKKVAGVDTSITDVSLLTEGLPLSFSVSGSTITVKVNNIQVIQVTDTSIPGAGYWGYETTSISDETAGLVRSRVGPVTIQTA